MNGALVVLLALFWALVVLPSALRSRRSSPVSSVGTFERAMGVLARNEAGPNRRGPRGARVANRSNARATTRDSRVVYVPRDPSRVVADWSGRREQMLARRRRMFVRLLGAVSIALVVGLVLGGRWWLGVPVTGLALVAYVTLLLRWKAQTDRAAQVVRALPDVNRAREVAHSQTGRPRQSGTVRVDPLYARPKPAQRNRERPPRREGPVRAGVRVGRWEASRT